MFSENLTSGVFAQAFNEIQEQKKAAICWIKEVKRCKDVKRLYIYVYRDFVFCTWLITIFIGFSL